ncbi:hypothetical protein D3C87_1518460 [compost metagenome]
MWKQGFGETLKNNRELPDLPAGFFGVSDIVNADANHLSWVGYDGFQFNARKWIVGLRCFYNLAGLLHQGRVGQEGREIRNLRKATGQLNHPITGHGAKMGLPLFTVRNQLHVGSPVLCTKTNFLHHTSLNA